MIRPSVLQDVPSFCFSEYAAYTAQISHYPAVQSFLNGMLMQLWLTSHFFFFAFRNLFFKNFIFRQNFQEKRMRQVFKDSENDDNND